MARSLAVGVLLSLAVLTCSAGSSVGAAGAPGVFRVSFNVWLGSAADSAQQTGGGQQQSASELGLQRQRRRLGDRFANVVIEVHPDWAPIGVERFSELVQAHFFKGARFFRVVPGFITQFGLNADPAVQAAWEAKGPLQDDPGNLQGNHANPGNEMGTVTYATAGQRHGSAAVPPFRAR